MISDFPLNVNQSGFVGSFQKRQVRQPRSPLRSWQPIAQSNDRSRRLDFQSRLQPPRKIKSLITVSGAMSVCSQTTNLQAAAPFTTANNFVSHDAIATSRCEEFQRSMTQCLNNSWVRLWRNFPTWRRFTAPGASPESVLITMSNAAPTPVARHRITKASDASLCGAYNSEPSFRECHQSFRGVPVVGDPRTVLDRLLLPLVITAWS